MKIKDLLIKLLPLVLVVFVASCGGENQSDENASKEFDEAEAELKEQIEEVIREMPPPSEIPFLLEATGADYNGDVVNDISKADSYRSTNDKSALNLGIYAADIGYLSSYEKTQEALNYLNTSKKLADHIGVIGAFDLALLQRFEDNLGDRDSLSTIINESITKTEDYLRTDERSKIAAMVLTGSFIEGLHISCSLVKSYPKDILPDDSRILILTPLIRVILDQEKPLEDLIAMLDSLELDEDSAALLEDLKALKASYEELNIQEKISQNRSDLVLTDETLDAIYSKVEQIRTSITS